MLVTSCSGAWSVGKTGSCVRNKSSRVCTAVGVGISRMQRQPGQAEVPVDLCIATGNRKRKVGPHRYPQTGPPVPNTRRFHRGGGPTRVWLLPLPLYWFRHLALRLCLFGYFGNWKHEIGNLWIPGYPYFFGKNT